MLLEQFPTIFYRCPGAHHRPGGTYDYLGIADKKGAKAALASGWHKTLPAAVAAFEGKPLPEESLDDDLPPTRAELELQASEMGIVFGQSILDEDLAKLIDGALAANG